MDALNVGAGGFEGGQNGLAFGGACGESLERACREIASA